MPHHFGTMKLKGRGVNNPLHMRITGAGPNQWKPTGPTAAETFAERYGTGLIPAEQINVRPPQISRPISGEGGLSALAIKRLEALRPKPIQKPNIKFNL